MGSDGFSTQTEFDERQRKADEDRIRSYLESSHPLRICALYCPTPHMHFLPGMRITDALTSAAAFFDMRREFHKHFGAIAKNATSILIFDDEALRTARHSADHLVDLKHLRRDVEPVVVRLGQPARSEVGVYIENFRTIELPALPTSSDWLKAATKLKEYISSPAR